MVAGDFGSYWRTQKYVRGVRLVGGRWYGAGVVMGKIGRNVLAFHRQNMFKVSPEHLRHASELERAVAASDGRELLGIQDLVRDGQNLLGNQVVDLTHQDRPPRPEDVSQAFKGVPPGVDEWRLEGDFRIRVHNKLRFGKFMPDPSAPKVLGLSLDDWRETKIRDSMFEQGDKPVSMFPPKRVTPLRAQPWLGETKFRIIRPEQLSQPVPVSPAPARAM